MRRSQRRPKLFRGGAASVLLLLAAVGCSPVGEEPADDPVPSSTEVREPEPEPEPDRYWPLTGMPVVEDGADEDSAGEDSAGEDTTDEFGPVLSVKVENSPGARPQGGLEHADVVWEELVEGGMTRFVAMFHSSLPETLGPIRSVRPMDAAIVGPVGGVLAFSGGQGEYQARIRDAGVVMVVDDAGHPGFYRNPERRGDHRVFGYPEQLISAGAEQSGPPELFRFGEEPSALAGEEVARVDIAFPSSRPTWEWNGSAWQRSESGQPAVAESGVRLEAANVVVLRVNIRDTGNRDSAGAMVPETILTGEGSATVFSGGSAVEGTWAKGGVTELLTLLTADGEELVLAPGTTWIELLPTNGGSLTTQGAAG